MRALLPRLQSSEGSRQHCSTWGGAGVHLWFYCDFLASYSQPDGGFFFRKTFYCFIPLAADFKERAHLIFMSQLNYLSEKVVLCLWICLAVSTWPFAWFSYNLVNCLFNSKVLFFHKYIMNDYCKSGLGFVIAYRRIVGERTGFTRILIRYSSILLWVNTSKSSKI